MREKLKKFFGLFKMKMTIIKCSFCASPNVEFSNLKETVEGRIKTSTYDTICKSCGEKGEVTEKWTRKGVVN